MNPLTQVIEDYGWIALRYVAALLLGVAIGHRLSAPPPAKPEAAADEIVLRSGDVVAERDPSAAVQPAKVLPKGARATRVTQARILPRDPSCEPVTLTTTLVRDAGGGQRAVLHVDGGTLVGAIDRPLADAEAAAIARRWSVGATYEPVRGLYGAFVERDLWRMRVGVDAQQTRAGDLEARVRVGWTF